VGRYACGWAGPRWVIHAHCSLNSHFPPFHFTQSVLDSAHLIPHVFAAQPNYQHPPQGAWGFAVDVARGAGAGMVLILLAVGMGKLLSRLMYYSEMAVPGAADVIFFASILLAAVMLYHLVAVW
jgi:hypothetical protein